MIKFLSYLGFVGSWYVSFLLASTLADSKIDYLVAFIFTCVMQFSSFYFFKLGRKNQNYYYIAGVLFAISILGTMSYQLSIHDKARNETLINSDEYTKHEKSITRQEDLIQDIKDSREELKASYDEQIKTLVAQRNAMPSNYITRKSQVDNQINGLKQELSDKLEKLNNSLIAQSTQLKELNNINITTSNLKDTKGYLGISNIISDFFEINKDLVVLFIQFIIAITFEATAILLHVSSEQSAPVKKAPVTKTVQNENITDIDIVKKNRKLSLTKTLLHNIQNKFKKLHQSAT